MAQSGHCDLKALCLLLTQSGHSAQQKKRIGFANLLAQNVAN
jgi:hypothetical protein